MLYQPSPCFTTPFDDAGKVPQNINWTGLILLYVFLRFVPKRFNFGKFQKYFILPPFYGLQTEGCIFK